MVGRYPLPLRRYKLITFPNTLLFVCEGVETASNQLPVTEDASDIA